MSLSLFPELDHRELDHRREERAAVAAPSFVLLPTGAPPTNRRAMRYSVAPLATVLASHSVFGAELRPNRAYPTRIQHRQYSGRRGAEAAATVIAAAEHLDPEQLLDLSSTVGVGPPLVFPDIRPAALTGVPSSWGGGIAGHTRADQPPPAARSEALPNGFQPASAGGGQPPQRLLCVAGNQRLLLLSYTLVHRPRLYWRYVEALEARYHWFGISDEQFAAARDRNPVLVRLLTDVDVGAGWPAVEQELAALNRASDVSFTKARDTVTTALTIANEIIHLQRRAVRYSSAGRARAADAAPIGSGAEGREQRDSAGDSADGGGDHGSASSATAPFPLLHLLRTLHGMSARAYLRTPWGGEEFFRLLLEHGVVPRAEEVLYRNVRSKRLSASGRTTLEAVMFALAFEEPELLDEAPDHLVRRVQYLLPVVLRLRGSGRWDLGRYLAQAVVLLGRLERNRRASPPRQPQTVEACFHQRELSTGRTEWQSLYPRTFALAAFLQATSHKALHELSDAFGQWFDAAEQAGRVVRWEGQLELQFAVAAPPEGTAHTDGAPAENADGHGEVQGRTAEPAHDAFHRIFVEPFEIVRRVWEHAHAARHRGLGSHAARGDPDIHGGQTLLPSISEELRRGRQLFERSARRSGYHRVLSSADGMRGRTPTSDAAAFAVWRLARRRDTTLEGILHAIGPLCPPCARTCRRRLAAWRRHPELWRLIEDELPPRARRPNSYPATRRRPSTERSVLGATR